MSTPTTIAEMIQKANFYSDTPRDKFVRVTEGNAAGLVFAVQFDSEWNVAAVSEPIPHWQRDSEVLINGGYNMDQRKAQWMQNLILEGKTSWA